MNKQTAMSKGYQFTGIYDDDKETVKRRAADLRKQGHKAVTVTIPPTGYERGGALTGYYARGLAAGRAEGLEEAAAILQSPPPYKGDYTHNHIAKRLRNRAAEIRGEK